MNTFKTLKDGYIYYVHENHSDNNKSSGQSILLDEGIVNRRSSSIYDINAHIIRYEDIISDKSNSDKLPGLDELLPEGEYVRYSKTNKSFENATSDVKQRNDDYFSRESDNSSNIQNIKPCTSFLGNRKLYNASEVCSYHVNVGHGNCSFIVFKLEDHYEMWAIDCSVKEFMKYRNYSLNVNKCLQDIKHKYNISRLSVLMVTHLHYDHINGIKYLIDNDYIDSNTEVWMNTNYPCNMLTYKIIESQLRSLKCNFIIPIYSASVSPNIIIQYPDINFDATNKPPLNHINNSSVLYRISLGGNTMLFTGDLETDAWKTVNYSLWPDLYENTIDFYCISHHGSFNGRPHIQKIIDSFKTSKKQILMGRDGAFPGIFSQQVLSDFTKIEITKPNCSYLEIQWDTGNTTYYG